MTLRNNLLFTIVILFTCNCYHISNSNKNQILVNWLLSGTANRLVQINVIGDSLSQRSNAFGLQEKLGVNFKVNDFSVIGWSTNDWIFQLDNALSPNPDIILIELGTNDAYKNQGNDFISNLKLISDALKQKTSAIQLIAVVPITNDPNLQPIIRRNNETLRAIPYYSKIELENLFAANGNSSLYPLDDPIHPNFIGYQLIGWEIWKKINGF